MPRMDKAAVEDAEVDATERRIVTIPAKDWEGFQAWRRDPRATSLGSESPPAGPDVAGVTYPPRVARNSCGVVPVCLRKNRAKWEGSEKARS